MKQSRIWAVSLALLAGLLLGLYWWQLESRTGPPNKAPAVTAALPAVASAPGAATSAPAPIEIAAPAAPAPVAQPPGTLDETLTQAFGRKAMLQWFHVDAFAHRIAVTVDNLARPHAPSRFWPVHPTPGRFMTQPAGRANVIAAANAKRYSAFVDWVETHDMKQVAALYRRLQPQFQRAYEELGYPGRSFDSRLMAVIDHLLETAPLAEPIKVKLAHVKGPIQPARPWVMVEFADDEVEERSSGQKLMLRIGKDNARRLKAKLAELRAALKPPR
jgi:hypothetical protein